MCFIYENACIVSLETHEIIFIKNSFLFVKRRCYSPVLAKEYFFFLSSISSSRASRTQRSNLRNAKLHFPLPARLNATLPFNARFILPRSASQLFLLLFWMRHPHLVARSNLNASPNFGPRVHLERSVCLQRKADPLLTQDNFFYIK